jgi:hypothetical protein
LGKLLLLLNDLQREDSIWLEGRVGVDEQLVDDKGELTLAVGLQHRRVTGLIAMVLHVHP